MATLDAPRSDTSTQVSVVPAGRRTSSRAFPARLLEVGDQHHLAPGQAATPRASPRPARSAGAYRVTPKPACAASSAARSRRAVQRWARRVDLRRAVEEDEAGPVLRRPARATRAPRRRHALRPAVAVAPCCPSGRAARRASGACPGEAAALARPEERAREGQGQEHEGRAAQREEQPVAQRLPPRRTCTGCAAGTSATGTAPSRSAGGG